MNEKIPGFPARRNPKIYDPNHSPYPERLREFYDPFSGKFIYPGEVIQHYADRYGVPPSAVLISDDGLISAPRKNTTG